MRPKRGSAGAGWEVVVDVVAGTRALVQTARMQGEGGVVVNALKDVMVGGGIPHAAQEEEEVGLPALSDLRGISRSLAGAWAWAGAGVEVEEEGVNEDRVRQMAPGLQLKLAGPARRVRLQGSIMHPQLRRSRTLRDKILGSKPHRFRPQWIPPRRRWLVEPGGGARAERQLLTLSMWAVVDRRTGQSCNSMPPRCLQPRRFGARSRGRGSCKKNKRARKQLLGRLVQLATR